jgi:hypothetical protein
MPEYLTERKSATKQLSPNAHFDIPFAVAHPGLVVLAGSVPSDLSDHPRGPHRLQLFRPGVTSPVLTRDFPGGSSYVTYSVPAAQAGSPQNWTARLTNLATSISYTFELVVLYPGTTEILTASLSRDLFASLANFRVHIARGVNASYIEFDTPIGPFIETFTVADATAFWGAVRMYPVDINSASVELSFAAPNRLHYLVSFEEQGREIGGTFAIQMANMRLAADLSLYVLGGKILVAPEVFPAFTFTSDVEGLPDGVVGMAVDYEGRIRTAVQNAAREQLRARVGYFGNQLTRIVFETLPPGSTIVRTGVDDSSHLRVHYYT